MAGKWNSAGRGLSPNAKVTLFGLLLLLLLLPFIWMAAMWLFSPEILPFVVVLAEGTLLTALLCVKAQLRTRREEQREADVVAAALRKAPI